MTESRETFAENTRRREDGALQLIDGHLRRETTPDMEAPVLFLDVTEDEADMLTPSASLSAPARFNGRAITPSP